MNINIEFIAQCVGVLGIVAFLLCFHFKNMKNVLKVKLIVDIIWGTHYFLLGAYSAFATNAISCIRELVFMNNNKGIFRKKFWLWLFVCIYFISAVFTWKGLYSIIPMCVSTLATFSFWQKDVRYARKIAVTNNVLMFTYDIFTGSYAGMVAESLSFFSVLLAMYRSHREKVTEKMA